ncbi:MAG: hypothetical protein GQ531_10765, partial [Sulfurovum sp.]|nr:hypothetical protein [Sulfurovum sp.]
MIIKKLLLGSALASSVLFAGGDVVPPEPMVEEVSEWSTSASIYMWAAGISGETARGDE